MAIKMGGDGEDDIVAEINMTPLIDIMLVLLILFMVTSSVSLESGLDIDLPKTSGKTKNKGSESVIVSINKAGDIFVSGEKTLKDGLIDLISQKLKSSGGNTVILEGDEASTLGSAIEIMDYAKKAGATQFAIATDGN